MDVETLKAFFMWCTIINVALLSVPFLFCACTGNLIYRIHGKWFPIPRETFTVVLYSFNGHLQDFHFHLQP